MRRATTRRRCSASRRTSCSAAWCCAAAIVPSLATDLPFAPRRRRDRAGRPVRARARVHRARRDGHRHGVRHARRAPRDAGRLPRRAGAADGALHGVADLAVDVARRPSSRRSRTASSRSIRASRSPASRSRWCSLAENARIPVDNPATHLELTMIHEAMILEYSARHLALIEWAAASSSSTTRASASRCSSRGASPQARRLARAARCALPVLVVKLAVGGVGARADRDGVAPRCASSARPSSSAPRSCSRCSGMLVHLLLGALSMSALPFAAQLINLFARAAAAARVRDALAAAHPVADQPVRAAGLRCSRCRPRSSRTRTRPAAPVLLGARSRSCSRWSLLPWLLHRLIRPARRATGTSRR